MTADPLTLLSRALDQAGTAIAGVREDQAGLPTPCRSWDVRTLVDHLVHDLEQFTARATGGRPDWSGTPPPVGDPVTAWRDGAAKLLDAWREAGDLSGTVQLPGMGEVPARFPLDQQIAELATHTWDLVTATGQRVELDPEVGEAALDWARGALRPVFRGDEAEGKAFGPEQPVPADAPLYDRLAAFFGRRPG